MKVSLRTANGNYLTAEDGGGTIIACNRPLPGQDPAMLPGEWEEFEVEDRGHGIFALKSADGFYVGFDPGSGELTCDRTAVGEWEEWAAVPGEREGSVAIQSAYNGLFMRAEGGGGTSILVDREREEVHDHESFDASVNLLEGTDDLSPPEPVPGDGLRLVGPLRRFESGTDENDDKTFADDNGPVFPFFYSFFPIMAIARRSREQAANLMERIAVFYPGFRTFLQVGGWTPYWDGLEVNLFEFVKWHFDPNNGGHSRPAALGRTVPAWPITEYMDTLRFVLKKCRSLGIRLDITFGDMQIICPNYDRELQMHEHISRVVQEEGGTEVVALVEGANEFPINHRGGDSPESIAQLAKCLEVWKRNVPGILTALGAIIDDNRLETSGIGGNVNAVHNDRDPVEKHLKHAFGTVYWEGEWRHLEDAIWYTEPIGPGKDSYQANADPKNLVAIYMLHGLLGAGSNFFSGPSVRGTEEIESVWGFKELPELARQLLPRDVHLWQRSVNASQGGVMYWHRDGEFRAVVYETWNPAPPFPVATWACDMGTTVRTGTGNPPKGMTGLLYGKFK